MTVYSAKEDVFSVELKNEALVLVLQSFRRNSYLFYMYEKETWNHVGICDLRIGHSRSLYYYGNIGYRVFPEYRGHGYAYQSCLLLFDFAREKGMEYLLITASPDNKASIRTCEKLGGEFLETIKTPFWHPLYHVGERVKNIYRYEL